MRNISDMIGRSRAMSGLGGTSGGGSRLTPLPDFGSNPGALGAFSYVPAGAKALVVVLHGCTQNAFGYDQGAGWSALAERFGFALLFPEQARANNSNLCFNWFKPTDIKRGRGEALSIRQMIAAMVERHGLDPARIFINGLSAGGAMTSVMLACYPELFAAGAIIAGLPYGSASSVPQALDRMRGQGHPGDRAYTQMVRSASDHSGPWPSIALWHGTADATVNEMNADAILGQWRSLHGVGEAPDRVDRVDGVPHRVWLDARGRVAIEDFRITGMGHGTPLRTSGDEAAGAATAFMLEAGISSTWQMAKSWGLLGVERKVAEHEKPAAAATPIDLPRPASIPKLEPVRARAANSGIAGTIDAALRQAGLMR